ncbi:MAG: hypothetical protein K5656_03250 [Lachnospiraceae bacterium]|nr:hypothetical protein [Lachnospiraceae bacterium]
MRVTNLMMSNNALYNLQKQEQRLNNLDQQYTTQKKISSPSEDPIIATRALKLNTTYSEVSQYVDKNIPDALAWMSMTQSALDNTQSMLSGIYEKCVQGNTDGLSDTDRRAIATTLAEYKDQIYQEGTSSYSGRFLFTGFKTDTNLVFTEDTNEKYTISEGISLDSVRSYSTVVNQTSAIDEDVQAVPVRVDYNRLRVGYDKLDYEYAPVIETVNYDDEGNEVRDTLLSVTNSFETYDDFIEAIESGTIATDGVLNTDVVAYIADRGEFALGDEANITLKAALDGSNFDGVPQTVEVTYQKNSFEENQLRPEHYFTCTRVVDEGLDTEKTYKYTKKEEEIKYLVNYNQQMTVNTQAKDCYTHNMGRDIGELVDIVNNAIAAEETMKELEKNYQALTEGTEEYEKAKQIYDNSVVEYELKTKIMQEAFAENETRFQDYAVVFSNQATDVGSREQRIELIKTRLENQQADVEQLQSDNIDVDLSEIIVRYTSAIDVYNAALSATSKSIVDTLLNYL